MKKIYWSLIGIGIIGGLISIFLAETYPLTMVGFFGIYLLYIFAISTYFFESNRPKRDAMPELESK